ncbi:Hypothetical predicted protein [Octopus vulgaris]|uniref:Sperm flagellar protein 2 n=1 Tax=Octopus vulgaris TaxID=6645 RepID=A0AA36FIS3_OCTVU|nr:Hypothetical predicted protein [Octopus vulgaris]
MWRILESTSLLETDIINFSSVFSNGYLIGETLSKYKQQDDLDQFSLQNTIEGRLNNFTRLEPSLHKLGLQFDTNTARDIMTEKHGAATNLMYELFVVLNGKTWKSRPAVQDNNQMSVTQSRLSHIENRIYNEHMNLLIPRNLTQSPTNTSKYFREKQIEKEKIAFKERFLAEEHIKMETKKQQEILHEQSRQLRLQQSEALAKLKTSDNYIYKRLVHPPALPVSNIFLKRKQLEIQEAMNDINQFDKKLESAAVSLDIDTKDIIKFSGDTYIADITKRLAEDRLSREDLEKRRRKVLVSQQQAQDLIWLAYRDKVLVNRILRQSQQEKKIVVQLLQTRQQKNIIMKNRMFQERQYQDRREKDFLDALNKEAELLRLAKEEYADQVLKDIRFHEKVKAEYKAEKYRIHYEICFEILLQILDIVCKICDYRAISSSLLPQKLMREWRALFIKGKPLYAKSEIKDVTESQEENLRIEEAKQVLLDEEDFKDYKNTEHDWLLEPDKPKPRHNPVVGHIVNRLLTLLYPPPPPPEIPVFPEFSIRVCLLGKAYSGKTFCAEKLAEEYNLKILNIDELVKNAIQTFHDNEEAASKANKPFRFLIKSASCIDKLEGKNELVSISRSKTIMPSGMCKPNRCVNEETGWILDGFPVTYCQTRTLEKALTGIGDDDDDEERRTKDFEKMQNVSQLLPNPHLDVPPAKKVSGLDVVILHNISDDLCLQRAAGQYISEKSKEHFHMLHNPPTFGQATGIAEREKVIPLISKSFDEENAQNRLMIFSNYWPKMEKWFSSLGNLHVVDASQDRDVVYEDIKSIIDEFLQRKKEEMFTAMAADENNVEEQPQIPAETENVANETQNTEENGKKHSAENLPKPEEEPEEKAPEPIEPDSPDWEFVDFEINMEYNEVPDDMRFDLETQTELHQTVLDLQDKLWNICDEQKQQAENECHSLISNGWYEDQLSKLCNSYLTIMQAELDRFQDTITLLKDYYNIPDKLVPPIAELNFSRLPLLESAIPDSFFENEGLGLHDLKVLKDRASSRTSSKQPKKGKEKEKEEEKPENNDVVTISIRLKIPLINPSTLRYCSPEVKRANKDGAEDGTEAAERNILETYQYSHQQALTEISNIVSGEQAIREAEEEEEKRKMQEKEKERMHAEKLQKMKEKRGKKTAVARGKKETEDMTPPPTFELTEEEKVQKLRKEKLKKEYYFAVEEEEAAVRRRLGLLKLHSMSHVFKELKRSAEDTYKPIKDWIGSRFLTQIKSIDQMAGLMKNAIENGDKLEKELILDNGDFYIDEEYLTLKQTTPAPTPEFTEYHNNQMTCVQLSAFLTQFQLVAPLGFISTKSFQETLEDLVSTSHGISALPELWMQPNFARVQQNIQILAKKISSNTDFIDWRRFILWASYPFPLLSIKNLVDLYVSYYQLDVNKTGFIDYEMFNSVPLWPEEDIKKHNESYNFDRSSKLKEIFFDLFTEFNTQPPSLNYEKMVRKTVFSIFVTFLFSFEYISVRADIPKIVMEAPKEEVTEAEASQAEAPEVPEVDKIESEVLNHGEPPGNSFIEKIDSFEAVSMNEILGVYQDVGSVNAEPIPFETLIAHPFIQDIIAKGNQFLMLDIKNILYNSPETSDLNASCKLK